MDPAQPMIDWINTVPPAELAAELMAAFGPGGMRRGDAVSADALGDWLFRDYPKRTGFIAAPRPVSGPISEAVQLLEHSELVYLRLIINDSPRWSITRLGTSTLSAGKDAIRQRIKDRTNQ